MLFTYENRLNVVFSIVIIKLLSCRPCHTACATYKTTMMNIMQSDLNSAFKVITNRTSFYDNILPQMYDLEEMSTNSNLKFALNTQENDQNGEDELILMQRKDFMKPVFPNLTDSYMALRRYRFSKNESNQDIYAIADFMKDELFNQSNDQQMNNGNVPNWSNLGLDGWRGEIAYANSTYEPPLLDEYPYTEIIQDINKGHINIYKERKNTKRKKEQELDNNVYIARVNDPFGFSTKWQRRNSSQQATTKYKRDVLRLYSMVKCSTGCDPLIYKGYGCYCGFLGEGVPVNGIDRCCKLHDKCYEHSNCISYLEYFVPYVWKCYRGKPLCAIDHGEWGGPHSCAARLCFCDLRLSRCLRKFACPGRRAVCISSRARRLQNILLTK